MWIRKANMIFFKNCCAKVIASSHARACCAKAIDRFPAETSLSSSFFLCCNLFLLRTLGSSSFASKGELNSNNDVIMFN